MSDEQLARLVSERSKIPPKDLEAAVRVAKSFKRTLGEVLVEKNLVSEDELGQIVADYFKVPYVSLKDKKIPPELLEKIPETTARNFLVIPYAQKEKTLYVATPDPTNFEVLDILRKQTGAQIVACYAPANQVREALNQYKRNIQAEFEQIIREAAAIRPGKEIKEEDLEKAARDLPIVRALDTILEYAVAQKASDVHIEGMEERVMVRFRIDGVLHDIITLPKEVLPALVARVKILANLRIDEHRVPQDGRFKFSKTGLEFSLRVSIIPAMFGENVVLRLLFESEKPKTLPELGITGRNLKVLEDNIKKTQGMILVTGPTGSGKTTTLYSILHILNTPEVKICTVEDPIEYAIPRVNQIQVNVETGLTFASGLRALLRHDPDIIMVGEIRDNETASIAVHAALTGHLVLSTLHTNDAPSALPRLLDLGAEPFLVSSTVNVVVAQRLVRRICPECKEKISPPPEELEVIAKMTGKGVEELRQKEFFQGKGCSACQKTGYRGRIGIYEVLEVTPQIQQLILKRASDEEIEKVAQGEGMTSMVVDGVEKAMKGITTLAEVLRVTRE